MAAPPGAIVTDIEGTTTRIAFVHDVLFPYARARLPGFLAERAQDPEIRPILDEIRRIAPGEEPLSALLRWMDQDAKAGPLKTLQGLIWEGGYHAGTLRAHLYADVAPALRRWRTAGLRLYVYSSGSVAAQKLLFAHAPEGDLTPLFDGFFDTGAGPKRETGSYASIAKAIGLPPREILFLSDISAELDAAAQAGWQTCQILRPEDGTVAAGHHRAAAGFAEALPS